MNTSTDPSFQTANLDLRWLRWVITVCAALTATNMFHSNPVLQRIAAYTNIGLGVLLCIYFGHILLRRLQCSLLEFLLIVIMLVNIEGLLFTSPGFLSFGWKWSSCLASVAAGWVLFGAVSGLAASQILGVTQSVRRIGLLAVHWAGGAAPTLMVVGAVLTFERLQHLFGDDIATRAMITPHMAAWGIPLLIAGAIALYLRGVLELKVRRAAHSKLTGVGSDHTASRGLRIWRA